jgi:uncharacterized protein (TIGR00251 family)
MRASWYRIDPNGRLTLTLYIQPNASRTEIAGLHDGALKIKVAAPPADHQANDKLLDFLRKSFKVSKKQVILKHGEHARQKIVEIIDAQHPPEILLNASHD